MKLPIRFECQAECEFDSAFDWYLAQSPDVADRFENAVQDILSKIQDHPLRFAKVGKKFRYYPVNGFPYRIIYRVTESAIEVVAVAHNSRRPNYWRK